ncbi:MAG: hypothetical protein V1863_04935 [Candidatus Omnitrophota bacterium]
MKKYYSICFWLYFCCLLVGLAGCSQPLRTLMALGDEQKAQQRLVDQQEKKFDLLWKDVKDGRLATGTSSAEIIRRYGEPVLATSPQTFLYRAPTEYFDTAKVYLVFDPQDKLSEIRIEEKTLEPAQ